MKMPSSYVSDAEMQAYVDGALAPEVRSRLEAFLSVCPEERERLDAYRRQNVLLHRLFDWPAYRMFPDGHDALVRRLNRRIRLQRCVRLAARTAAAVVVVAAMGSAVWASYDWASSREEPAFAFLDQGAVHDGTRVGVPDRIANAPDNPAAIKEKSAEMLRALSARSFGMQPHAPDLEKTGFRLIGVRSFSVANGPTIQFLYGNDTNDRVTLLVRPNEKARMTPSAFAEGGHVAMVYGEVDNVAYSLVGNIDRKKLMALAATVLNSFGTVSANAPAPATSVETGAKPAVPIDAAPQKPEAPQEGRRQPSRGNDRKGSVLPDAKPAQPSADIKTGLNSPT